MIRIQRYSKSMELIRESDAAAAQRRSETSPSSGHQLDTTLGHHFPFARFARVIFDVAVLRSSNAVAIRFSAPGVEGVCFHWTGRGISCRCILSEAPAAL